MNQTHAARRASQPAYGFTLVEVLVVLVIIAVLAAVGFQAVTRVRSMAKRTLCINQLKSWGIAMGGYASDHGGKIEWEPWPSIGTDPLQYSPYVSYWTPDSDDRSGFATQLAQRNCPAVTYNKSSNSPVTYSTIQPIDVGKVGISGRAGGSSSAYALSKIKFRSRFMFMIETVAAVGNSGYSVSTEDQFRTRVKPLTVDGSNLRHDHAVNALFADYSVRPMSWKEVESGLKWWSTF